MKKELFEEIEIPEGVEINIEGSTINIKGPEGENSREFNVGKLQFKKEDNKIKVGYERATKTEKKKIKTISQHIRNMIKGVQEKFTYTLKICSGHFPMTVENKDNQIIVKNFLGEKKDRKVELPKDVEVNVDKETITIKAIDKEKAGQAAANMEKVTAIKNKDKRVYQDGIYITNKAGEEI